VFKVDLTEIDPRKEARAAVRDLLDKLTWLALTVGVVTTVVGLVRVTRVGWHLNVVVDQVFFLSIVVVLVFRKRLPVSLVVTLLIALGTVVAAVGFLSAGLGTMSFVTLTACCTVAGVIFGMRAGFLYLGGTIVGVGLIGNLVCAGKIDNLLVTDPYLLSPQAWVSQLSGYAGFAAVILVVSGALQTRLSNSLSAVSRQAEELRESESRYRLLADNMHDVLFLQNMDFSLEYVTPSAERLFDYTVEELLKINVQDMFAPGSRERAAESFQHALARAEEGEFEVPPMEFEYLRKDGSTFWGEVTPTFIRNSDGRIVRVQGLLRDITVRKQIESEREELERELRQSEKLKAIGQLAGGIAHDFNNQLVPIMAHADLLVRGLVDQESVSAHARKIITPARNAADLTSKLLAFARKGSYEHRPVDVHEVINEVAEILVHGIDRRIEVKRHYDAAAAVVEGDRTQIQNVLLNLALNARDAMPNGGEIVFKTRISKNQEGQSSPSGSQLFIQVEDTGEGMDEAVLERVFEPFFTTKAPGKGTGMGLAAAYGTVASHSGRIEIASQMGRGTVVSMSLPLTSVPTGIRGDSFAESIAAGVGRVLVVDDEDSVRSALTDLLETLGCSVVAFGRAREATEYFKESWTDIDLVVLDLVLPDMNGREVLAVMREVNPDVRVLLVSGYTADDEIRELLHSETIEFLEKPFLLADLAESMTRLTSSR
jgi:PAS domain S-box-containing protein